MQFALSIGMIVYLKDNWKELVLESDTTGKTSEFIVKFLMTTIIHLMTYKFL